MSSKGLGLKDFSTGEHSPCDLLILATGFEDRALGFLERAAFSSSAACILVAFDNDFQGNSIIEEIYRTEVFKKFSEARVRVVRLRLNEVLKFKDDLLGALLEFTDSIRSIGLDVSGLPAYSVFAALDVVRNARPYDEIEIIYTAAEAYVPSEAQYRKLVSQSTGNIDLLPPSLALEMEDNLVFEPFAGHRTGGGSTCLALFAGYEPHRSAGVIDAVNPSLLLLIYGDPTDSGLGWRLEFSRMLHARFEANRRCAIEVVPTHDVDASLRILERYYEYLIDDFDLIISPVCSKIQIIAAFLFWEKYPEVQVSFPLPIGYNPENRPKGKGRTAVLSLPGRVQFLEGVQVQKSIDMRVD